MLPITLFSVVFCFLLALSFSNSVENTLMSSSYQYPVIFVLNEVQPNAFQSSFFHEIFDIYTLAWVSIPKIKHLCRKVHMKRVGKNTLRLSQISQGPLSIDDTRTKSILFALFAFVPCPREVIFSSSKLRPDTSCGNNLSSWFEVCSFMKFTWKLRKNNISSEELGKSFVSSLFWVPLSAINCFILIRVIVVSIPGGPISSQSIVFPSIGLFWVILRDLLWIWSRLRKWDIWPSQSKKNALKRGLYEEFQLHRTTRVVHLMGPITTSLDGLVRCST